MPIKELKDGTQYEKAVHHNDKVLKGIWEVTYKIDGVRSLRGLDGRVVSRNSKPLYNLDHLEFTDAEIFRNNWETSVSLVRTQSYKEITQNDVYQLKRGELDERLIPGRFLTNPRVETREMEMEFAVNLGYEGIVLRGFSPRGLPQWIKVVPKKTIDIRITDFDMSDKRAGYIKCFHTNHGNISATGFPIEELNEIREHGACYYIGRIAEVEFREWTPGKKMRFPAWVRWRFDKNEESLT